jgi:hypothetical protein
MLNRSRRSRAAIRNSTNEKNRAAMCDDPQLRYISSRTSCIVPKSHARRTTSHSRPHLREWSPQPDSHNLREPRTRPLAKGRDSRERSLRRTGDFRSGVLATYVERETQYPRRLEATQSPAITNALRDSQPRDVSKRSSPPWKPAPLTIASHRPTLYDARWRVVQPLLLQTHRAGNSINWGYSTTR